MQRFARLCVVSLVVSACGARTELDNVGYADGTDAVGVGTVNPITTIPTFAAPTPTPPVGVEPPFPTTTPVTPPVTPIIPVPTATPTTTPIGMVTPCTDADARRDLLRIVIPPDTPQTPSPSACGDGILTPPEQCDKLTGGAGCAFDCTLMRGWVCPPDTYCFTRCGDGIPAGSEQCDDGNTASGDGCDSSCSVEWDSCLQTGTCPGPANGLCGNGIAEFGEGCDEGGETELCDSLCQFKPLCDAEGTCVDVCGDGVLGTFEQCDDGNLRVDDGCDADCAIEAGHVCTVELRDAPAGEPLPPLGDAGATSGAAPSTVRHPYSSCSPLCGDNLQQRGEECDPGLTNLCNSDCTLVSAFCGNGILDPGEGCDDGVNDGVSRAGCAPGCQPGYCGDGIVQEGEACDLGTNYNTGAYAGCTSGCQLAARCGDGIVQACGEEECDDGNQLDNDGCSLFCNVERWAL